MKHQTCITTTFAIGAVSLFGLFAFSIRASGQTAPAHQGAHDKPTSEKAAAVTNAPAMNERVDAETQSPPGTIGKNWPKPVEDSMRFGYLLVDQLEYRMKSGADDTMRWDAVGWFGGDYNRLWLKTEGEWRTSGERGGEAEVQALYGRLIAPFWDFQAGLRYDQFSGAGFDRSRGFAVIGLQGLARYRFELEPALFISQDGDVSARITATYDMLITQRLILQPRFDFDTAVQSAAKFGVGEGSTALGWACACVMKSRASLVPILASSGGKNLAKPPTSRDVVEDVPTTLRWCSVCASGFETVNASEPRP